jgi:hypothetical protein
MSRRICLVTVLCIAVLLTHGGCKRPLPDPESPAPPIENTGAAPTEAGPPAAAIA